jgi:hypothetical protein
MAANPLAVFGIFATALATEWFVATKIFGSDYDDRNVEIGQIGLAPVFPGYAAEAPIPLQFVEP